MKLLISVYVYSDAAGKSINHRQYLLKSELSSIVIRCGDILELQVHIYVDISTCNKLAWYIRSSIFAGWDRLGAWNAAICVPGWDLVRPGTKNICSKVGQTASSEENGDFFSTTVWKCSRYTDYVYLWEKDVSKSMVYYITWILS